MTTEYRPRRIILNRDTPQLRGTLPAGTVLTLIAVNAICTQGQYKSWDIHGLSPDNFEFIHDDDGQYEELSGEVGLKVVTAEEVAARVDEPAASSGGELIGFPTFE